jgi:hypothetical protein
LQRLGFLSRCAGGGKSTCDGAPSDSVHQGLRLEKKLIQIPFAQLPHGKWRVCFGRVQETRGRPLIACRTLAVVDLSCESCLPALRGNWNVADDGLPGARQELRTIVVRSSRRPLRAKENIARRKGNFGTNRARSAPTAARPSRCLHGLFQVLRGAEGNLLAGLDLNGLASRRVAAHTGGTFAHLQDAEATDSDALALL